ncbi:MAG TPA: hypothetical protein VF329_05475 [Gammaproteobacteria bacterium]
MISDYHLRGGETGLTVVEAVRTRAKREIPVVFLTGNTTGQGIDIASVARARLLTKPLRGDELLETIQTELAAAHPRSP